MELLQDHLSFPCGDHRRCRAFLANFRKIKGSCQPVEGVCEHGGRDLLHAVAGLCSVALPDMELTALYSSLTAPGTKTIIILTTRDDILQQRLREKKIETDTVPHDLSNRAVQSTSRGEADGGDEGEDNPFAEFFSGSENSETESEPAEDEFEGEREAFLSEARHRRTLNQLAVESVGAESCVVGCATCLRLTSKPGASAIQTTLLAVRRKWRGRGVGKYLMQCCKDPEVVGYYDVLLAFADHKAEGFFTRHGFIDDPLITARYRDIVDHWENSTLMCYLTPFSGHSAAYGVNSLKGLSQLQEHLKAWRDQAIAGYSIQLSFMERVRHEVLLLHSKLQSQEGVVSELSRQLREVKAEKAALQAEFSQYRKHVQGLLCESVVGAAERWVGAVEGTSEL